MAYKPYDELWTLELIGLKVNRGCFFISPVFIIWLSLLSMTDLLRLLLILIIEYVLEPKAIGYKIGKLTLSSVSKPELGRRRLECTR